MKQIISAIAVMLIVVAGCKKNNIDTLADEPLLLTKGALQTVTGQFVPNELLIKFKKTTSQKSRTQLLSIINGKISEQIITGAMINAGDDEGVYLVSTTKDVFSAIARMKGESDVAYAEPNWIYSHAIVSDDKYFINGSLWGMYGDNTSPANQYGCQAALAWAAEHTGSSDVFVGVIDEGAMYTHEDLLGNFGNPREIAGNKKDDDGNGKVDDTYGWDFVSNDNTTFDGTSDDHGTHVSGTIGAVGGNGKGVAGVNWHVKIISAKFLGRNGGTTANAIKAVDYLTGLKNLHPTLDIVASNNSWGGGGFSQGLLDAIARGANKNILFIAAAGNNSSNNDIIDNYPSNYNTNGITVSNGTCNYDAVIAVAALVDDGSLAYYSNYGATTVDLGAPGSGIYSTLPPNTYGSYSGTSMATPHVTGGAALYAATHVARGSDLRSAIITSITPTSSISKTSSTPTATGGRLNVGGF